MAYLQKMPVVNPNDEHVRLEEWVKDDEEEINEGETICIVETSKAVVEIEAENSGFLISMVKEGEEVKVGSVIAIIKNSPDEDIKTLLKEIEEKKRLSTVKESEERGWTKKAEIIAHKHGVDLSEIPAKGVIKEADVEAFLRDRREMTAEDLVEDLYPGNLYERILVLGGARGAVQTIDIIQRNKRQKVVGILDDDPNLTGKKIMGHPILGPISKIKELQEKDFFDKLIISFSSNLEARAQTFEEYKESGFSFANIIDPSALILSNVQMGEGNLIMSNCRLGACSIIGNNNVLSAYVNIEHHNEVGSHCTFGPGVMTSGSVKIANRVKFGTGIFIEPRVKIGEKSTIASGSVLTNNVPPESIVKVVKTTKIRGNSP